jgi:predicted dithiol-disulfide oxidoreductase (DUF899 family)
MLLLNNRSHRVVSRDQWLEEREALLVREKELTRSRDRLALEQRALPWVKIEKDYVFEGPAGSVTLAQLFDGRSQLFVKHFMMGPGQTQQCIGCSLEVDHIEGLLVHLENHDVTYAAVARAPLAEIEVVRQRMGWRFNWVSSYGSDFNYDFNVSFAPHEDAMEDVSGNSVFYKDDAGQIFHTYSTSSRGGEEFLGIYRYLDVMPKGRGEDGPYRSMADWARPRNMYGRGGTVEGNGRFHVAGCSCGAATIHSELEA